MSIYVVQLAAWFPLGSEHYSIVQDIAKISRCFACGDKVRYNRMVGHHSLPWGNGDVWCDWKCSQSGKIAKPDKRRLRRYRRQSSKHGLFENLRAIALTLGD